MNDLQIKNLLNEARIYAVMANVTGYAWYNILAKKNVARAKFELNRRKLELTIVYIGYKLKLVA